DPAVHHSELAPAGHGDLPSGRLQTVTLAGVGAFCRPGTCDHIAAHGYLIYGHDQIGRGRAPSLSLGHCLLQPDSAAAKVDRAAISKDLPQEFVTSPGEQIVE